MLSVLVLLVSLGTLSLNDEATPVPLEDRLLQTYSDLLEPSEYSTEAIHALRSRLERERETKIEDARRTERQWKAELDAARHTLDTLNKASSTDSPDIAEQRKRLHVDTAALERGIQEKITEREEAIPENYAKQLAKLWLIEHWPEQQSQIARRIESGQSRDRRHGDVEDIGYRRIAKAPEEDVAAGQQAARQMMAGGWLPSELKDDDVQSYVRRLANQIAANSDLKVPLHVTVLESSEIKVIPLAGGFLYVTSGTLRATRTESQLAGVLSREIARIAARHAFRASRRSIISRVFLPAAQIATGIFSGGMNAGAYYGMGYGIQGLNSVADRVLNRAGSEYQKEADQLGLQYAWKAGFDPKGFLDFMDALPDNAATGFFPEEPELHKRLLNMYSEIAYLRPVERPTVDSPDFRRARERLMTGDR